MKIAWSLTLSMSDRFCSSLIRRASEALCSAVTSCMTFEMPPANRLAFASSSRRCRHGTGSRRVSRAGACPQTARWPARVRALPPRGSRPGLRREERGKRKTHEVCLLVAEHAPDTRIPRLDHPREVDEKHRVVGQAVEQKPETLFGVRVRNTIRRRTFGQFHGFRLHACRDIRRGQGCVAGRRLYDDRLTSGEVRGVDRGPRVGHVVATPR
jgi:hypothetical protein